MKSKSYALIISLMAFFNSHSQNAVQIDNPAPPIIFSSCIDSTINREFLANKVIVIDFWATWCIPCIKSFPAYNELINRFRNRSDIVFLSISNENKQKVTDFFLKRDIRLDAFKLIDDNEVTFKNFEVTGLPLAFVIGKDARIKWIGAIDNLQEKQLVSIANMNYNSKIHFASNTENGEIKSEMSFYTYLTKEGNASFSLVDLPEKLKSEGNSVNLKEYLKGVTSNERLTDIRFVNFPENEINFFIRFQMNKSPETRKSVSRLKDPLFPENLFKSFFFNLLANTYNFSAKWVEKKLTIYELKIVDTAKFNNSLTKSQNKFSWLKNQQKPFLFEYFTISQLCKQLSGHYGIPVITDINTKDYYDFLLDVTDINSLVKSLASHGLLVTEKKDSPVKELEVLYKEKKYRASGIDVSGIKSNKKEEIFLF